MDLVIELMVKLQTGQDGLKLQVDTVQQQVDLLEAGQAKLEAGQIEIKKQVDLLEAGQIEIKKQLTATARISGALVEDSIRRVLCNEYGASYPSFICLQDMASLVAAVHALLNKEDAFDSLAIMKCGALPPCMAPWQERLLFAALEPETFRTTVRAVCVEVQQQLQAAKAKLGASSPKGTPLEVTPASEGDAVMGAVEVLLQGAVQPQTPWTEVESALGRLHGACAQFPDLRLYTKLLKAYANAANAGHDQLRALLQAQAEGSQADSVLVLLLTTVPGPSCGQAACQQCHPPLFDAGSGAGPAAPVLGVTHLELDALGCYNASDHSIEAVEIKTQRDGRQQVALRARALARLLSHATGTPECQYKLRGTVYFANDARASSDEEQDVDGGLVRFCLVKAGRIYR